MPCLCYRPHHEMGKTGSPYDIMHSTLLGNTALASTPFSLAPPDPGQTGAASPVSPLGPLAGTPMHHTLSLLVNVSKPNLTS